MHLFLRLLNWISFCVYFSFVKIWKLSYFSFENLIYLFCAFLLFVEFWIFFKIHKILFQSHILYLCIIGRWKKWSDVFYFILISCFHLELPILICVSFIMKDFSVLLCLLLCKHYMYCALDGQKWKNEQKGYQIVRNLQWISQQKYLWNYKFENLFSTTGILK